ncbi:MAG: amino acid-binding protein [Prevotellaceae bacterium]|nr:amino acid-binding protein [Candidatus Colivivens equi]MCQ2076661.1 amino acid-binding protein [Bacteroidaceae bacterium]
MTIQQLSVFIENQSGTLLQVLNLLSKAGIQLLTVNISDTVEYGILRIICSNPTKAYDILKEHGISVALADAFAIELADEIGEMSRVLTIFKEEGISLTYLYSFLLHHKGIMTFRTTDAEHTIEVIKKYNLKFVEVNDLYVLR